jgi:acyl-CoA thioester hydrolase
MAKRGSPGKGIARLTAAPVGALPLVTGDFGVEHDHSAGRITGREHRLPLRIYYEDTDFSGVVYHANYVRYLERGRSEFIRAVGASHTSLMAANPPVTFMVSSLDLRFVRPARIDDRLEIRTTVELARGARIVCRQSIRRDSDVILEADVENVCVSFDGRPRRVPAEVLQRMSAYLPNAAPIRPANHPPANDDFPLLQEAPWRRWAVAQ